MIYDSTVLSCCVKSIDLLCQINHKLMTINSLQACNTAQHNLVTLTTCRSLSQEARGDCETARLPLLPAKATASSSSPPPPPAAAAPIAFAARIEPSQSQSPAPAAAICPTAQVAPSLTLTPATMSSTSLHESPVQAAGSGAGGHQHLHVQQQLSTSSCSPNSVVTVVAAADAGSTVVPPELQERVPEWRQQFASGTLLGLFASATERREASVRALSSDLKRHLRALYERSLAPLGAGASDVARVEAALGGVDYQQQQSKLRIYFEIIAYLCSEPCYSLFVTALVRATRTDIL